MFNNCNWLNLTLNNLDEKSIIWIFIDGKSLTISIYGCLGTILSLR
jgi:hypothetical protein